MKFQRLEDCEGYTLAKSIIDDNNTLVLKQGTVITSHIILRLKNFGLVNLLVEDPVSDGIDVRSPISDATLIEACRVVDYQNKPAGKDIDVDKVFDVAGKLVNEICENAAIIGNGFQTIKMYDENTSLHSVNVAVMATMFGMSLGYDPRKLNNLGVGGLLHDIGKSRVPIEIICKSGKLDEKEILEVRKHPQHGWDILDEDVLIPATVKAIALQHHENWDGSGYPKGLKEYEVYELAAIVHICDVFDALISKRTYKDSFSFTDSIRYMKEQSGKMFSPYFLKFFFRKVPIFHTGTDVFLNNGEKAIIVSNNNGDMTRPVVRLYKDMKEINLFEERELKIVS